MTMLRSVVLLLACASSETAAPPVDASPDAVDASSDAPRPTSRGPAYDSGTAGCPARGRVIKLVNNCSETRWFKLDARTTPTWARPTTCAWAGETCTDHEGVTQCSTRARERSAGVDPGEVYCKAGKCACNPYFELAPGEAHEIALPVGEPFESGTGWLAIGCNALGSKCALGDVAARNSTFEWTYDKPGGSLYYDLSAVNAWTTVSAVGLKSCGGARDPKNKFRCSGAGCRFDVTSQCPDGSDRHASAPSGCITCPTKIVGGKQVLGECGPCPDGASANRIPTDTVFNPGGVGGPEWTFRGAPDFATMFGFDEGARANRRFECADNRCSVGAKPNTCLGGCDLCTVTRGVDAAHPDCLKYCCPDIVRDGYRYDSAGCTALGVQRGTDYTVALKSVCPYVYTYGYEDHSSTFICDTDVSLLIQACPDATDFPSAL